MMYSMMFCILDGSLSPDIGPSFSITPIPLMYLNKNDTVIVGCSVKPTLQNFPIAWAFENKTEFYFTEFHIKVFSSIPLSLYGKTNLLVNSTQGNYHNVTYLCQLLVHSSHDFLSAPVTFFVYGK